MVFRSLLALCLSLPLVLCATDPNSDPYTCAPDRPCKIGCCSNTGVCGLGPKFCGSDVCISGCNSKADCDPGWGSQWSKQETCPLNVCCSEFGFCGTTKDFCGDKKVKQPSCSGSSASKRIIGYYEGWSSTRACRGQYPEDLLNSAYTHLNYAFAFVDPESFKVAPMSDLDVSLYPRFTGLKTINPSLETWISIGGWSMNDPDQPTAKTFSQLAASPTAQKAFFSSLVNFMSTYGFDGVDIDWEYPVAPERSGNEVDYANYVSFLKALKNALGSGGHKYGLTLTLPSSYWYMQNFDIKALADIVDWFNVMTYDLHGTWDSTSPYIGSIVNAHTNLTEIDLTMDLLWRNQIDPGKVVMGTGFYGRSFTLSDPSCSHAGCAFSGGGNPGPCSASAGTLMYSEIQDIVAAGAKVIEDEDAGVAIVTWDNNQWVSYDNANTLKKKVDYANSKCLGGLMVWAASTDDASGSAIKALNSAAGRTPGLTERSALFSYPKEPTGQCVWGECDAGCPSGYQPASGSGGKVSGYAGIFNGCDKGKSRYYCCPSGSKAPKCTWKGSPKFCGLLSKNRCKDNEVEVTTTTTNPADGTSCWTGHMSLCCEQTESDSEIDQCKWKGAAPFCTTAGVLLSPGVFFTSYGCEKDEIEQTTGKYGAGGEQPCLYDGGFKSYCCKKPDPWANRNCAWHQGSAYTWTGWAQSWLAGGLLHGATAPLLGTACKGECPTNQVAIASDGTSCQPGTYSYYCCDNPNSPQLPAPGDVSMCPSPPNIGGTNTNTGPEGDKFEESIEFDGDCVLHGLKSSTRKIRARDGLPISIQEHLDWELEDLQNATYRSVDTASAFDYITGSGVHSLDARDLEKRTLDKGAALQFCAKGQTAITQYPQTYSGYRTVAKLANRGWITIAKPAICGAIGVAAFATEPANVQFVTEHVFEKQSLRNYIQYMTEGVLPGGGATLKAGTAIVTGIFDVGGSFFSQWPSGNQPSFGGNPWDSAFGCLGHAEAPANYDNLQVCDRDLNAIKARIAAGVQFLAPDGWKKYGELQQVSYLADVIDTFSYMQFSGTVTSYNLAYKALIVFWKLWAKNPGAQAGYDYVGAFQDIVSADLDNQVAVAKALFQTYLTDATNTWNDPLMIATHGSVVVKANQAALKDFATNIGKYIAYDKLGMLK